MSKRKKEQLAPIAPREPLSATSDPRTRRWFWPLIAAALLAVIAIYHQVPSFAFTDWDDTEYISENALLKGLSGLQVATEFSRYVMGNYHPITMLSYSAEIALFGKSPGAMHVTNLLLHLLNVVLVGLFLRKLTRSDLLAALVALLWAVHPMRVESVAWLSARKDLLMLCFGLLMLLAYLQWRDRERPVWYLLAFVAFLFSGLSKAMAVSFVPCLLLIDLAQGRSLKAWKPWTEKIPFAAAALIIGVVAVLAQRSVSTIGNVDLSTADRFWTGGANLRDLHRATTRTDQPERALHLSLDERAPARALSRTGDDRPRGARALCVASEQTHLVPVRHRLHAAPLVARAAVAARGAGDARRSLHLCGRDRVEPGHRYVIVLLSNKIRSASTYLPLLLGVLMALPYAWLAYQRTEVWRSAVSVRTDMIAYAPRYFVGYMDRAISLDREGDLKRALADYDKAVRLRPANDYKPYFERGMFHFRHKAYREAMPDLLKIFQHVPSHPGLVPSMLYAQTKLGLCPEVIGNATAAMQLDTGSTDLLNIRANCLLQGGRYEEARTDIDRSLAKKADYGEIWYLKAWAALQAGDSTACCEALIKSLPKPMSDADLRLERDRLYGRQCR